MRALTLPLIVVAGILGAILSFGDLLQAAPQTNETLESPNTVARGVELPRYLIVEEFFDHLFMVHRQGDDWFYFNVLREMGIKPESPAEQVLVSAILRAKAVLTEGLDLRPFVRDEELFWRKQEEFTRDRVQRIAEIYRTMLSELEQVGVERAVVESFIDREIAPGMTLVSDETEQLENNRVMRIIVEEFRIDKEQAKSLPVQYRNSISSNVPVITRGIPRRVVSSIAADPAPLVLRKVHVNHLDATASDSASSRRSALRTVNG